MALDITVSSVVDVNTKLRDTYALELTRGQEVRFTVDDFSSSLRFFLAIPGSSSFVNDDTTLAFSTSKFAGPWERSFVPAANGTYYFDVKATTGEQTYTLSATLTGNTFRDGGTVDIPGTPLALDITVSSVVDVNTKLRDIYALELTAGQEVSFTVDDFSSSLRFFLAHPGSSSFVNDDTTMAFSTSKFRGPWRRSFVPATSDTYHFEVKATTGEQPCPSPQLEIPSETDR